MGCGTSSREKIKRSIIPEASPSNQKNSESILKRGMGPNRFGTQLNVLRVETLREKSQMDELRWQTDQLVTDRGTKNLFGTMITTDMILSNQNQVKKESTTTNTTNGTCLEKNGNLKKTLTTTGAMALFKGHKLVNTTLTTNELNSIHTLIQSKTSGDRAEYVHPLNHYSSTTAVEELKKQSNSKDILETFKINLNPLQYNSLDNRDFDCVNYYALNLKDYYLDQKLPQNLTEKFTDPLFPPNYDSIIGKRNGEYVDQDPTRLQRAKESFDLKESQIIWLRASEIFLGEYSIFTNSIDNHDINQGDCGNCYFHSSLTAMTERPQLIVQLFKTLIVQKTGLFEIAVRVNGKWKIDRKSVV